MCNITSCTPSRRVADEAWLVKAMSLQVRHARTGQTRTRDSWGRMSRPIMACHEVWTHASARKQLAALCAKQFAASCAAHTRNKQFDDADIELGSGSQVKGKWGSHKWEGLIPSLETTRLFCGGETHSKRSRRSLLTIN